MDAAVFVEPEIYGYKVIDPVTDVITMSIVSGSLTSLELSVLVVAKPICFKTVPDPVTAEIKITADLPPSS